MSLFKRQLFFSLFLLVTSLSVTGQNNLNDKYKSLGTIYIFQIHNAEFPHPKRADGHIYDNKTYTFKEHYNDSSVLVFVPKNFRWSSKPDLLIHFHGWFNHIDSAAENFKLLEQFAATGKNALFIISQGPKDAPDSFGGKFEDTDGFKNFITEVLDTLSKKENKKYGTLTPNNIILSGHSGGYRVISFILLKGGLTKNIKEVWLFDALYGDLEKFAVWLQNKNARFVNIYTQHGGTFETSKEFQSELTAWKIPFWSGNENELTDEILQKNKIISVFTPLEHNETLYKTNFFRRLVAVSRNFK